MPRIFKRGELLLEAEEYRALLDLYDAGEITGKDIVHINADLIARFGSEGLSRIKSRAWKLKEDAVATPSEKDCQ